jgi:hypothetical protein
MGLYQEVLFESPGVPAAQAACKEATMTARNRQNPY